MIIRLINIFIITVLTVFCVHSQEIYHTVNFNINDLYENQITVDDDVYSQYYWDNLDLTNEVGYPSLPIQYVNFLVPTYCKDISVQVTSSNICNTISCKFPPYPCQPAVPINEEANPQFVKLNSMFLTSDNISPTAKIVNECFAGGCNHIVTVGISPMSYSGQRNVITIFDEVTIKIQCKECDATDLNDSPILATRNNSFLNIERYVANYNFNKSTSKVISPDINEPLYYYIITPQSLKDGLEDFIIWKRQKGYIVKIVTIEDILNNNNYKVGTNNIVDEAASLRAYLTTQFTEISSPFFCLLVGDWHTSMPIRKIRNISSSILNPNSKDYIPTDNYFSDLTTTWKLSRKNNESIYSAESSTAYAPDIYVGRLLCHSQEHIKNYLEKLMIYESNPGRGDRGYLNDALFFEQHKFKYEHWDEIPDPEANWNGSLIHASKLARKECGSLMNVILIQDRTYTEGKLGPTGTEVIEKMRNCGISNWYGHGSPYGVQTAMYNHVITTTQQVLGHTPYKNAFIQRCNGLDHLNNKNKPSIVYSISCENAPFDCYERDDTIFSGLNLAQIFTISSKDVGGPAFLGNSREGHFVPNKGNSLTSSYSPKLNANFYVELDYNKHIGVAEANSKIGFTDSYDRATHNLIGEPEFEVWTSAPKDLDMQLECLPSGVAVTGKDMKDCKIIVSDGFNSNTYIGNNQSLLLPYINNDPICIISIWKTGYLPIIKMRAESGKVTNTHKTFLVRDAAIGNNTDATSSLEVGKDAYLRVRAIDYINCEQTLTVASGGKLNLQSDEVVNLNGCKVSDKGYLEITGGQINLSNGFSVERGGELVIH